MLHLNAAYNLLSHLYTDVIIQTINHINEYNSMCDMVDHYASTYPTRKPIFIADRGHLSFNVFAHAIENGTYFLIRAKDGNANSILKNMTLPDSPEFDIVFERWLTRRNTKTIKAESEVYKSTESRTFDYLEPKANDFTISVLGLLVLSFQMEVRRSYLPIFQKKSLLPKNCRNYIICAGIETSFRDIKYPQDFCFSIARKRNLYCRKYMQN